MKPNTMILMLVAVSCGLGASYMTSRLLADRQQSEERVAILVAAKNLNIGDTIKVPEDMFVEKQFTKGEEPRLAFTDADKDKLKGRMLKRSLRSGDFVTPDDLHDEKSGRGSIAYDLPPGFVAVGIRVNPESIAGGFASLPHSRVNIIWTRRGSDKESFSKTLLENVLVLAADTQTIRSENNGAMLANVVTVALKQDDAMKLTLAKSMGTIDLVLRRFNDTAHPDAHQVNLNSLIHSTVGGSPADENSESPGVPTVALPGAPKEATPVAAAEKGARHTLTIYNGEQLENVDFELDKSGRTLNSELRRPSPAVAPSPPAPKTDAPKTDAPKAEGPAGAK